MIECVLLAVIRALSRCVRRLTLENAAETSERVSRIACHFAVLSLPEEAKDAFRSEILIHLLELVWDDLKRRVAPEVMVAHAARRAIGVLYHSPELRNDYREMVRNHAPAARSTWRTAVALLKYPLAYWRWRVQRWRASRWTAYDDWWSVFSMVQISVALWMLDPLGHGAMFSAGGPVVIFVLYTYSGLLGQTMRRRRERRRAENEATH